MANDQSYLHKSGMAAAALWSGGTGMLALAVVQVATHSSKSFNTLVHSIGKAWMPGAEGIGPYSGKETVALAVWLSSWVILHYLLRDRNMNYKWLGGIFLILIAVATTLLWPPVWDVFPNH